jgi:hypothetical protein
MYPSFDKYSHQFKVARRSPQETKIKNVRERTRTRVSLHSYAQVVEEKVMLWQHASSVRLRVTTRLQHPSLNRQEAKSY